METYILIDSVAPSEAPQSIKVFNSSSTSIKIVWSDIVKQHQNGIIRGFRIRYYERDEGPSTARILTVDLPGRNTRERRAVEVKYDFHSQEIQGLNKFTEYVVQILGYTTRDGNYSDPIYVRTGEDGKI